MTEYAEVDLRRNGASK